MGTREGEKKDKIVISKLSHALHDSLQTHCTTRSQGSLAKLGDQELARYPKRKKTMSPFPSLVVKVS